MKWWMIGREGLPARLVRAREVSRFFGIVVRTHSDDLAAADRHGRVCRYDLIQPSRQVGRLLAEITADPDIDLQVADHRAPA